MAASYILGLLGLVGIAFGLTMPSRSVSLQCCSALLWSARANCCASW
jgi:hypothetical protein